MTPARTNKEKPVIEAADLFYIYPGTKKPALDGLTFAVEQGEIFGLLGPNGAGKTTALCILSTIFHPKNGRLIVCGVDANHRPQSVRNIIGLIPQELALYPALTLKENLSFFGRLYGLRGKTLKRQIDRSLEAVGLASHGDARVKYLSGGMKRRGNIAIALIHRPQVLFLDEPTVGVDIHTRKLIFHNLRQLKKSGITMIYTTHYMEDAEQLCDRITIMNHGRNILEGKTEALIREAPECKNLEDLFLHLTGRQIRE